MVRRLSALAAVAAVAMTGTPVFAGPASRDGLIAYDVASHNGFAIAVAEPGKAPRVLKHLPTIAITPRWSPDGRWIAFAGANGSSPGQVYVVHPDGTGLRQVTHDSAGAYSPSWLPNGHQLLAVQITSATPPTQFFEGAFDGIPVTSRIVTVKLTSGAMHTVYASNQELEWPTWSRAVNAVVFSQGTYDIDSFFDWTGASPPRSINASTIESVHLDGTGLKQLAAGITPDVSPTGKQIAYTGLADEQIHVMNIDGSADRVITQMSWADNPCWNPDGHSILLTGKTSGRDVVHVMHVDVRTKAVHDIVTTYSAFADQQPRPSTG